MNSQPYRPGSPKSFHAYPRGDFDLETGIPRKAWKPRNSLPNPIMTLKLASGQIKTIYKLQPVTMILVSLSFGVTVLVFLSLYYESQFRMSSSMKGDGADQDLGSYPLPNLRSLVMVAGHSIYMSTSCGKIDREDSWFLEPYQKNAGQATTFVEHIKDGVEIAAKDEGSLLLFSGGETRRDAGPRSEAQSYWAVAESKGWFGNQENVRSRALTEEHARDSFENLLFSVCRFRELTGTYPHNITVVSYDFKEERFAHLHRSAIGFPEGRFSFFGTPTTPGSKEAASQGEALVRAQFQVDPYGCSGSLYHKRLKRDPFHRYIPYPNGCPELKDLFSYCGQAPYPGTLPWVQ